MSQDSGYMRSFDPDEITFSEGIRQTVAGMIERRATSGTVTFGSGAEIRISVENLEGYVKDGELIENGAELVLPEDSE